MMTRKEVRFRRRAPTIWAMNHKRVTWKCGKRTSPCTNAGELAIWRCTVAQHLQIDRDSSTSVKYSQCNAYPFEVRYPNASLTSNTSTAAAAYHRTGPSGLSSSILDRLNVARRHALCDPSLLNFGPSISLILFDQHEPLALLHAMFGVTLRVVLV